ncbi:phenylalanine--tRNA ligase beta subunit-related protein [Emergencia sp. JLR.KK010]|uniref:B3/B4 domain-containing protein n=1 Tax=Emergencia sp. JLR.KK010 TaxID=3114296 RepID=UPI0030CE1E57
MRFEIAKEVFDLLPNGYFGIVAVKGMDNTKEIPELEAMLQANIEVCEKDFEGIKVKNADDIVPYREAFRAMGINPNRYMCSIEALLDRIAKGKGFPHINAIVDLGNAVSIKYHLPIGAHDMATIDEALEVRHSKPEDTFIPFGNGEMEKPEEGEVVYVSAGEVRTRRWTWRQSEIGKITEETRDVLFPIDGFTDLNKDKVEEAAQELAALAEKFFGVKASVGYIDKNNRVFEVE